ncbi:hypothetical protein QEN19_003654 [Hanseniaspora menglaensis]
MKTLHFYKEPKQPVSSPPSPIQQYLIDASCDEAPLTSPGLDVFQPFKLNSASTKDISPTPLKPILKPSAQLNFSVTSSSSDENFKDAVIFGTQINIINAIKIRQNNKQLQSLDDNSFDDKDSLPVLPLPCNVFETITIRINTEIKKEYIRKKCIEDKGGYYYDFEAGFSKDIEPVEEYAVIKADFIGPSDKVDIAFSSSSTSLSDSLFSQTSNIKKSVRFE